MEPNRLHCKNGSNKSDYPALSDLQAVRELDSGHYRKGLGKGLIMRPNQYISKSDCAQPAYPASTVFFSTQCLSQIRITEINKEATFVNRLKTCSNYANRLLTSNSCAMARNVLTLIITFILSPQVQA